jgi:acyl-CoA thioesterase
MISNPAAPFPALLSNIAQTNGAITASAGDDWRQGRTLYGGLSAALCVEAAGRLFEGLPPLRSAQFAFVGPASGAVSVRPELLRRGKSTAFIGADLHGEAGLATRATLCFAAPRSSALAYRAMPAPAVPPPASCPDFFARGARPAFARNFDAKLAGGALPCSASASPEIVLWIRHAGAYPAQDATALVALADVAPPAAMAMFAAPAPISTMTWSVEMLRIDAPASPDGWTLLRSTAQSVSSGYAAQLMELWDEQGCPLMISTQCVAVFA